MNFSSITNINTYTSMLGMKQDWQQKATGAAPASASKETGQASTILDMLKQQDNVDHQLASITHKMDSGENLSPAEMEYLREKYPDLYDKAMKLAQEKKAYEEALRRCETKDDVRALHMSKVAQTMTDVKDAIARNDLGACMAANAKMNAMARVLADFVKTSEYGELAGNETELAEAQAPEETPVEEAPETEAPEPEKATEPEDMQAPTEGDIVEPDTAPAPDTSTGIPSSKANTSDAAQDTTPPVPQPHPAAAKVYGAHQDADSPGFSLKA